MSHQSLVMYPKIYVDIGAVFKILRRKLVVKFVQYLTTACKHLNLNVTIDSKVLITKYHQPLSLPKSAMRIPLN